MFPAFAAAKDVDLHSHEKNGHFHLSFRQVRDADRVFLRGHDHRQVAPNAAVDEATDFVLSEIMVINKSKSEVHVGPELPESVSKTLRRRNCADGADERAAQAIKHKPFARINVLE